jgi:amino acid transporter
MSVVDEAEPRGDGGGHLDKGALGLLDSIVMGVAGVAPAYSIALVTPLIVLTVGLASPAALLWCGIPMFGISVAYYYLNKMGGDAGAAYAWVGKILHPYLGFICGWSLVISATIFMVEGSLPAGQATIQLFSAHAAGEAGWYTAAGVIWFLVMAYFVARGVRVTANAQWIMSTIEIGLLLVFLVWAFIHTPKVEHFSFSWLWFTHFGSGGKFADGALIAAFYYWGWDVSSNLSEETENSEENSGRGGMIGVIIVFLLFELFTIVMNMVLSEKAVAHSSNPLTLLGQVLGHSVGAKLMIIALMLSTIATLETTLIQSTRSLFSMGRERTIPSAFGRLHPSWETPVFATGVIVVISIVLFVASNFAGGISKVLTDGETAIDIEIMIYYALAGFAAFVAFRKLAIRSLKNAIVMGVFPLVGGAFMLYVFIAAISTGNVSGVALYLGLGGIVIGIVPLAYYARKGSDYYKQKPTLGRVVPTMDSGREPALETVAD